MIGVWVRRKTLYAIVFVVILLNTIIGVFLTQYYYEPPPSNMPFPLLLHDYYPFFELGVFMIVVSIFVTLLITAVTLAFYHTHKAERASFWSD